MGAVADDQEAEYIRNVCENDIVTGENLLAALRCVSSMLSCHICIGLSKCFLFQSFSMNSLYECFSYFYYSEMSI